MAKKLLSIGLKAALSLGLIWYLVSDIELARVGQYLTKIDIGMLILSLLVLLLQVAIGGIRWSSVLRGLGAELPLSVTTRLFYISIFFNQALPGGNGGDVVRMYLSRKYGLPLRNAINGVIIERIATVLALVFLVDCTQPFFVMHLSDEIVQFSVTGAALITILAAVGIGIAVQFDKLPKRLLRWKILRGLGNLGFDTRHIIFSFARGWRPILWSLVGHINVSLVVFILATGLGLDITLFDCVVIIPPILLILTIPISIGGWGVREGAMVWGFALIGVSNEAALALSLLFGVIGLMVALPGGIVWLVTRNRSGHALDIASDLEGLQHSDKNT